MRGVVDEFADAAIGAGGSAVYDCDADNPGPSLQAAPRRANTSYVRLEIRTETLFSLINDKTLVIEDLRGLDRQAKRWIRERLLETLLLSRRLRNDAGAN
jgi:hypothetical protein